MAIEVRVTDTAICLRAPYERADDCRAIPGGKWNKSWSCWVYPKTPTAAARVLDVFGQDADKDGRLAGMAAAVEAARAEKTGEPDLTIPHLKTKPWRHQVRAFQFAMRLPGAMLALGMGCVDGETIVTVNRAGRGFRIAVKDLFYKFHGGVSERGRASYKVSWNLNIPTEIRCLRDDRFGKVKISNVIDSGIKKTVTVTLKSGKSIKLTPDHELLTDDGFKEAKDLFVGDTVMTNGRFIDKDGYARIYTDHERCSTGGLYEHILIAERKIGRRIDRSEHVHHINGIKHDNRPENLEVMSSIEHWRRHGKKNQLNFDKGDGFYIPKPDTVVSIEDSGESHTYDIVCEDPYRNFVANGIVVHNCGKSLVSVGLALNRGKHTLILCPKSVVPVWPLEFSIHSKLDVHVLALDDGSVSKKQKMAEEYLRNRMLRNCRIVVVINYDSAWREPFASWALKAGFDTVVFDELHACKAPSGKRSKFCERMGKVTRYRIGLTGTPMPHSPLDVFAQMRALDPGVYGTSWTRFRARYAVMGGFGGHQVVNYQNLKELHTLFDSVTFQAGREVITLPAEKRQTIPVKLGKKAHAILKSLENDLFAAWDAGELTATNVLTKLIRQAQICGGHATMDDGSIIEIDTAKREALADLMDGLPLREPLVVFARFHQELDAIRQEAEKQGRVYAELSGRQNNLAAWQAGDGDVLGVQLQSGGVGINLTRACYCAYFSLDFSLGNFEQSLCRIHRPGQTRPVTFFFLVAQGTIDEDIIAALSKRKNVVEFVLAGLPGKWEKVGALG